VLFDDRTAKIGKKEELSCLVDCSFFRSERLGALSCWEVPLFVLIPLVEQIRAFTLQRGISLLSGLFWGRSQRLWFGKFDNFGSGRGESCQIAAHSCHSL